MLAWLGVFFGGGVGSLLRHLVCSKIANHWGVMLVNVLGALLIGFAYYFFANKINLRPEWRSFVITGLLGGFTTFSTLMLDFGGLMNSQRAGEAVLYLAGSLLIGIAFLYLGILIARNVL